MEYWNNPTVTVTWPSTVDPIAEHLASGTHALYFDPCRGFDNIVSQHSLADLCAWAQSWLTQDGLGPFVADVRNHYDIANLVKLNMWRHDMLRQGIVKPWMLLDQGDGTYLAGTGESRLRALEGVDSIVTTPAFVSTRATQHSQYQHLESVSTLDQFATLCGARTGQTFMFRFTDSAAPYGIYWYEYNSERTRSVTPGQDQAVALFVAYMRKNPNTKITLAWFDQDIDWLALT
jgi:hypothetical protein